MEKVVYYDDLKEMVKGYLRRRGVKQGLFDMLAMLYGACTEVEKEGVIYKNKVDDITPKYLTVK